MPSSIRLPCAHSLQPVSLADPRLGIYEDAIHGHIIVYTSEFFLPPPPQELMSF